MRSPALGCVILGTPHSNITEPGGPRVGGKTPQGDARVRILTLSRGTSLAVQWLIIRLPMQGTWVRSLVGKLRSHMPQGN